MDAFTLNQYTTIIDDIAMNRAGGSGATATAALNATGRIYSATIAAGGADYEVDDVLTVATGTGGTFTVNSVDGSGAVTGVSLTTAGTGYDNVTGAVTTGGTGTGATLTTVCEFGISAIAVTAGGEGYFIVHALAAETNGSGGVLDVTLDADVVDSIAVTTAGWYRTAPVIAITSAPQDGKELLDVLRGWDIYQQDARLKAALIDSQFVNVGNPTSAATVKAAIAAL